MKEKISESGKHNGGSDLILEVREKLSRKVTFESRHCATKQALARWLEANIRISRVDEWEQLLLVGSSPYKGPRWEGAPW